MLLLKSHDSFDEYAYFDPATFNLDGVFTASGVDKPATIRGHFARIGRTAIAPHECDHSAKPVEIGPATMALFRSGATLFLHFSGHRVENSGLSIQMPVSDDTWVHVEDYEFSGIPARLLRLGTERVPFLQLAYEKPIIDPPLEDDYVSSFVEEEDFDFGLFVRNVISDPHRRNVIYRAEPSAQKSTPRIARRPKRDLLAGMDETSKALMGYLFVLVISAALPETEKKRTGDNAEQRREQLKIFARRLGRKPTEEDVLGPLRENFGEFDPAIIDAVRHDVEMAA